jgi:peptidoglycan/xylan/chitin deacetylase (PgdA/CDA1 family)
MVSSKEISVLLFHRVSNDSDALWPSMPIKSFEKLIKELNNSVDIISLKELKLMKSYPSKPVILLSFDDGYVDFYENVMPVFKHYKIKANHNICPGLIDLSAPPWTQILSLYLSYKTSENEDFHKVMSLEKNILLDEQSFLKLCKKLLQYDDKKRNDLIHPLLAHIPSEKVYKLMNWEQVKYCSDNDIEIGSHGYMHRNLLQIWDTEILYNEIEESRLKIVEKIGVTPDIFAFANAMGNDESKQFVRKSGYHFSFILMDKQFIWQPINEGAHMEIPRINISRSDWREEYLRALGFHEKIKNILIFFKQI